jgi:hypothetical protein
MQLGPTDSGPAGFPTSFQSFDDTAAPHSVQNPSWSTMRRVLHPAA